MRFFQFEIYNLQFTIRSAPCSKLCFRAIIHEEVKYEEV